jgi:hypothetical protein
MVAWYLEFVYKETSQHLVVTQPASLVNVLARK